MVNKELSVMEELMLKQALIYQLVRAKDTVEYWLYNTYEVREQWLKLSLDEFYAVESLCQIFSVKLPDDINLDAFKQRLNAELFN